MKRRYLEVIFSSNRPIAAYLYLPRSSGERSHRTSQAKPGLIVDYARNGAPIGIEITAPTQLTVSALNMVLSDLGLPLARDSDLAPLRAA